MRVLQIDDVQMTETQFTLCIHDTMSNAETRCGIKVLQESLCLKEYHRQFLIDMTTIYMLADFCFLADRIVIEVPVSKYLAESAQELIQKMFSWLSWVSKKNVVCQFIFLAIAPEGRAWYVPQEKTAMLGWSGGKESLASALIAQEAGYTVHKETFLKGDELSTGGELLSMIHDGTLYKAPTVVQEGGRYFDYQSYVVIQLLSMLMMGAEKYRADTLLVGGEYGTSAVYRSSKGEEIYELAADEGRLTAKWFSDYMREAWGMSIGVYSPVAAILEVGIIRFLLSHGYHIADLRTCWSYSQQNCNCESCMKCSRLKMYARYLIERGYTTWEDFHKAFRTEDFPDIASLEQVCYSMYTVPAIKDIKANDTRVDWSSVWIDSPDEMEHAGPFLSITQKYFRRYPFADLCVRPLYNPFDKEYVRGECIRYLGEDYREKMLGDPLHSVAIPLPYEHEVHGMDFISATQFFTEWVVYKEITPVGVVRLKGPFYIPSPIPYRYETTSPVIQRALQKDFVLRVLAEEYPTIEYTFETEVEKNG